MHRQNRAYYHNNHRASELVKKAVEEDEFVA